MCLNRNLHGGPSRTAVLRIQKEGFIMAEKKTPAVSPATESAADPKTRKTAAKAPARRGRPPLAPELYVELNGKQYNITDVIDRAKADYRATHKVGVQSCKVYVKPEEGTAYYVINKVSGKLDL